ncbi:hypothetical protein FGADI_4983 [Fusarium gaditjirri]|uniref:RING-type domain-containing protein n=1 Tax=Fusarium gaditjirri TaxID=282569 RepID=A0A8H4TBN9_9HYPO|nr:hypothetical protein FGADI_4983 [Fusarium gaditjirri]
MTITETFFPALLQACDNDPSDALDIQLTCGICQEQITFADEAGPHLRAFVLACMHIFCNGCVEQMVAHSRSNNNHYACPACRNCLHCRTCRTPAKKGSLIHMNGEQSIPLLERIVRQRRNLWTCFDCDVKTYIVWLHAVMRVSKDYTEIVDNGQFIKISVKYQRKKWEFPSTVGDIDLKLVKKQSMPRDLEMPVKIIEDGLLKAHGIAGPDDGTMAFKYKIFFCEPRDKEHEMIAEQRSLIEHTEDQVRKSKMGYRKLITLELSFDLRDSWTDVNVRELMKKASNRAKRRGQERQ